MNKNIAFIIPVFNEGEVIVGVIENILTKYQNVICVNDGSSDNTEEQIKTTDAFLVNHTINLGQGASLQTGIDFALTLEHIEYFVTFDADGQHQLKDVDVMVSFLANNKDIDIVLGSDS